VAAVVAAAAVVVEGVGVVDDVEDDGEFAVVAAEIEDNVAVAVDGEVAPPTVSALNVAAAAPNVPVVASPVAAKWKDAADTPSSLSVSPSPSPSPSRTDESPSPYRYPCP